MRFPLTSVDGAEKKGYEHLPPQVSGRATSALAGHAYSVAGQAASALHSMAVHQVFQVKMLAKEDAGLDSASLRALRSATDLALRTTKATAQEIGRSMSSLWLKRGVTLDTAQRRKVVTTDAVQGQTNLRSVVRGGIDPAHQLPRNASSMSGLSILPTGNTGTPCASMLRQQVRGVIHKSPGRPRLEATLHAGERPFVGPEQSTLAEGDACAGQNEPRSRHVVEEQRLFGGMDASPAHGSEIWKIFDKARVDLFAFKDNSHCPIFFTRPTNGPAFRFMLFPRSLCYCRYSDESGNDSPRLF